MTNFSSACAYSSTFTYRAQDENVTENQAMAELKSLEKDIVRTAIIKDKNLVQEISFQQIDGELKEAKYNKV